MHKFWSFFIAFLSQLNARNVKMMDLCKKYTLLTSFFAQNTEFLNVNFRKISFVKKVK